MSILQQRSSNWTGSNRYVHTFTWSEFSNVYTTVLFPDILNPVLQICGDYLLSKIDSQSAISYRNFASSMADGRLLGKIDGYIQDHLQEISEQDDFLKLPRLKVYLSIYLSIYVIYYLISNTT